MAKKKWIAAGVGAACIASLMMLIGGAEGQVQQGKTRKAATKYLMRGVIKPHCSDLGKLLKAGPADDKAWDTAACHASCLNEMGHVLMADGRCPDAVWAGASKKVQECSGVILEAIKKKDLEGARSAFKVFTAQCKACHTKHKKK